MLTTGKEVLIYMEAVRDTYPEHAHLKDAEICVTLTDETIRKAGNDILGLVVIPMFQSTATRLIFEMLEDKATGRHPDAYMILDEAWWREASPEERVALVYHELYHLRQKVSRLGEPCFSQDTGRPVLQVVGHDVEEFLQVVAKFGDWKGDYAAMSQAMSADADVASLTKCLKQIETRLKTKDVDWRAKPHQKLPDRSAG